MGRTKPIEFSVDELKKRFEKVTVTTAIQCAGNRRSEFFQVKTVKGLPWGFTAISNAKWTGVRLRVRKSKAYCKVSYITPGRYMIFFPSTGERCSRGGVIHESINFKRLF